MKKVNIKDVEIAYREEGVGKSLVFLHAFPLNQTMWDEQVTACSPYYRVITLDWRGFGKSAIGSVDLTMSLFADDLAQLLDHLQIERTTICGLSMGGYVAFDFYRRYSDRVNALILCDTRATADTEDARRGRYEMAELARRKGTTAIAEQMIPRLLSKVTMQSQPEKVQRVRAMIEAANDEGIAQALTGIAQRDDSSFLLSLIGCPTLVVVGNEDKLTPPGNSEMIRQSVKRARLEVIENAGHLSNIENPAAFNRTLINFLNQL